MRTYSTSIALCFALLFFVTACDSGGSNDNDHGDNGNGDTGNDQGQVSFSITGEGVDESFTGNAFFATGEDPESGEEAFVVYSFAGDEFTPEEGGTYAILGRSSSRPSTGSYSFANLENNNNPDVLRDQFTLMISMGRQNGDQVSETYFSSSGGLEITASSSDRIAGEFDLTGQGFTFDGNQPQEVEVSISGSFDAPGGEYFSPITFSNSQNFAFE